MAEENTKILAAKVNKREIKAGPDTGKIAVVLIRGLARLTVPVKDTFRMLNLTRKNQCVVVENNPGNKGMIIKIKDFITWGEISEEVFAQLVDKRGKEYKSRSTDLKGKCDYSRRMLEHKGKKYKRSFNLNPPRKGFGRKGIKVSYQAGGALGYRGEKINDLLLRMI